MGIMEIKASVGDYLKSYADFSRFYLTVCFLGIGYISSKNPSLSEMAWATIVVGSFLGLAAVIFFLLNFMIVELIKQIARTPDPNVEIVKAHLDNLDDFLFYGKSLLFIAMFELVMLYPGKIPLSNTITALFFGAGFLIPIALRYTRKHYNLSSPS
jgi:hypothetical protein